ncbi:hypothetical protein [Rhodospira trueperi]|uniref:hypothetical protein n=1 Tax=Rhodospira trueperi TaxID=69960 RepID=UPI0015A342DE|nr:hypothetical protein [Rhodospira trueperi]
MERKPGHGIRHLKGPKLPKALFDRVILEERRHLDRQVVTLTRDLGQYDKAGVGVSRRTSVWRRLCPAEPNPINPLRPMDVRAGQNVQVLRGNTIGQDRDIEARPAGAKRSDAVEVPKVGRIANGLRGLVQHV